MPLNLVPDSKPRGRGQHGDQINTAILDTAISRLLELHDALNDGTEKSAMGWINEFVLTNESIDPNDVKKMLEKIYHEVNSIHAEVCSARKTQSES